MECKHFQLYLRECVEQHRPPEIDRFAAHLEDCPDCRREWTEWRILDRAIAQWRDLGETPDLAPRVMSELAGGSPSHSATRRSRPASRWIAAATAVTVLAVLVPLLILFAVRRPDPAGNLTQIEPDAESLQPVVTEHSPDVELSWEQFLDKTRTAYGSLLSEAGIRSAAALETLSPHDSDAGTEDLTSEPPTSLGLLTRDLRESVGFLGRLLPDLDPAP
jgi:hypothetical protein